MKIGLILVVGLVLRLIGLNQSLWLDEAITARVARNYGYQEIVEKFSVNDFHQPLYYLFIRGWGGVFGYSEDRKSVV